MRKYCVGFIINQIKKQCPEYSQEQLEVIQYGLESLYILVTKMIVLITIAYFMGILIEFLISITLFGVIRSTAFGLHAKTSGMCYISSIFCFNIVPWICAQFEISLIFRIIIGIICICYINKYAPADTENRPIISEKRRNKFKLLSTLIATLYVVCSTLMNGFISNSFIFVLIEQCFMISPNIYQLFKLPYANYKNYLNQI